MACWVTLQFEDGTEEDVNLDLVVRVKRNKNDGKKTFIFPQFGDNHWVVNTVEEIREKRNKVYAKWSLHALREDK